MLTHEQLFSIANAIALLSWLALALLPRVRFVREVLTQTIVPISLAITYIILLATHWGGPGGFSSLSGVATLFSQPGVLLAGWIHYLAFDLLVGTWEAQDAHARGISRLLLLPCLFLTFMFGPAGWLAYQVVRRFSGRASAGV
ncbi:MAG: ABA4-like family protein [Myxococcaceae bacterium]